MANPTGPDAEILRLSARYVEHPAKDGEHYVQLSEQGVSEFDSHIYCVELNVRTCRGAAFELLEVAARLTELNDGGRESEEQVKRLIANQSEVRRLTEVFKARIAADRASKAER